MYEENFSKFRNEIHLNHTEHTPLGTIFLQVVSSLLYSSLLVSISYNAYFKETFRRLYKVPKKIRKFGVYLDI